MSHEIVEIKKLIVGLESDKQKSNRAWDDLMSASDQISEKWTEVSAADEIRSQREKTSECVKTKKNMITNFNQQ